MVNNQLSRRRALLFLNPRSRKCGDRAAHDAVRQLEAEGLIFAQGRCAQTADMTREITRLAHEVDLVIAGGGGGYCRRLYTSDRCGPSQ
jgi:hypothetical protein